MLYRYFIRFDNGQTRLLTVRSKTYKILEDLRRDIQEKIDNKQKRAKTRYDKVRLKHVRFNVGDDESDGNESLIVSEPAVGNESESENLDFDKKPRNNVNCPRPRLYVELNFSY